MCVIWCYGIEIFIELASTSTNSLANLKFKISIPSIQRNFICKSCQIHILIYNVSSETKARARQSSDCNNQGLNCVLPFFDLKWYNGRLEELTPGQLM